MNIATQMLFLHGHVADPKLAVELAAPPSPHSGENPNPDLSMETFPSRLLESLWYLGGLDDLEPRIGLDEDTYGPSFGNRIASRRAFDTYARRRERRNAAKPVAAERRAISCA
jgi:hypothetical protein